ncbi:beta-glucosidase [Aestuariicella hydrocarbonica]|uniref:Beta-D-glucoside glucohydrolase n=1 Tax=Pseudomaricurvus hydrocarbonicus TaxID=1470433 RepID=A0A9E5T210_9GAMM|nr:glycoside hydrolase family 3 C-terminal domain-containing protein [Aestuariicella hydrocarbonica]NHO67336.1 beta-glucosidase [Aestuariicella hydrocarbonica]
MPLKTKYLPLTLTICLTAACSVDNATEDGARQPQILTKNTFRDLNGNGKKDLYEDTSKPIEQRVDDILSRLSLDQKVNLVMGTGMNTDDYTNPDSKVPGAAGYTYALNELGIASIVLADGPAGLRISPSRKGDPNSYFATAFPIGTLLASTWDTDMLTTIGQSMGEEVKEYGVDILLAPGMNIHRNPRGGRNFEYYSEDPVLSGKSAAAMVNGIESNGVGATIKHYVANNQETNRFLVDTIASERALREIYLRGFEIAVKDSQPWGIMSSYNKLNGSYTPQSENILTQVLRDEWDFQGLVMTDWFAGDDAVAQMNAGNDLIMPGTPKDTEQLAAGLESGQLDEKTLDRNLQRILKVILQSPSYAGYPYSNKPDLNAHAHTARQAAAEGAVLLKNTGGALPLAKAVNKVAVFGNTSYDFISGGAGSGDVNEAYTVSLVDGLQTAGYHIDSKLASTYEQFLATEKARQPKKENFFQLLPPIVEMPLAGEALATQAAEADIALITLGRNSGEFQDRPVEGDFTLTAGEQRLIADVSSAFHAQNKQVVVILNVGNVLEIASWRDQVDAILLPWQGGQEAGNAIADVLTGKVNPSGKLPTTMPVHYRDVPSSDNFPGVETSDKTVSGIGGFAVGKPSRVDYEEGIFVGYRYYDTFNVEPAYEFGYGLSYTQFEYGSTTVSSTTFEDSISVSVTVTNNGKVAGKEVVQVYLSAPEGQLKKPVRELKGFAKTRLLAPAESQQLTFTLKVKELASFDESRSSWVADKGIYKIDIGASSRDIRQTVTFELPDERIAESNLTDL